MPINSTNYISSAQCVADTTMSSSASCTILSAATAIATGINQDGNKKVTVPTLNDLPNLDTCAIGSGHIVFVESINVPVVSSCNGWYALDGRSARKDVPDRRLWVWGNSSYGQGMHNLGNACSPVTTCGGGTNWKYVTGGGYHFTGIKTDGTLWLSGRNTYGQLGTGNTTGYSSPVTTAGGGTNWCTASGGMNYNAAIKTDGTLWTWGYNLYGNLGTGNTTGYSSPVTTSGGGTTWSKISAGCYHNLATKTNGTLWAWGRNSGGPLGTNDSTNYSSPVTTAGGGTNWCLVAAGSFSSAAIKTDGTLWTFGGAGAGQLGTGSASNVSSPVTTAGGGTNWSQVSLRMTHVVSLKADGTVWTWGCGGYGTLGDNTVTGKCSPVTTAGGGTNWCQVFAGGYFSGGLKTDGTLWMWGNNSWGTLGDSSAFCKSSPVSVVGGITSWCQVSAGGITTYGITSCL